VGMEVTEKYGIIYMITKFGYVHLFDIESGKLIYMRKISDGPIFATCEHTATQGILGVSKSGQVFSASCDIKNMIPFIHTSLKNNELAKSLVSRGFPVKQHKILQDTICIPIPIDMSPLLLDPLELADTNTLKEVLNKLDVEYSECLEKRMIADLLKPFIISREQGEVMPAFPNIPRCIVPNCTNFASSSQQQCNSCAKGFPPTKTGCRYQFTINFQRDVYCEGPPKNVDNNMDLTGLSTSGADPFSNLVPFEQSNPNLSQPLSNLNINQEQKTQISDDDAKCCVICFDQPADVIFLPCKHMKVCSKCAYALKDSRCPLCRQAIKEIIKPYL